MACYDMHRSVSQRRWFTHVHDLPAHTQYQGAPAAPASALVHQLQRPSGTMAAAAALTPSPRPRTSNKEMTFWTLQVIGARSAASLCAQNLELPVSARKPLLASGRAPPAQQCSGTLA